MPGDSFVDLHLRHRANIDPGLPQDTDQTLSFAQFVAFAVGSADRRINAHWQPQDDLLNMSGLKLDFVGKVKPALSKSNAHRRPTGLPPTPAP